MQIQKHFNPKLKKHTHVKENYLFNLAIITQNKNKKHANERTTLTTQNNRQKLTRRGGGRGLEGGAVWNATFSIRTPNDSKLAAPTQLLPFKVINLTRSTPN